MSEQCGRCFSRFDTVYILPDDIWLVVSGKVGEAEHLCPKCADELARENGIALYWTAAVNEYPAPPPKETP